MASLSNFQPTYFTIDVRGAVVIAHITKSALSEEDNIEQLGQELSMLVDQFGCRRLVVNFQAVTLITSAVLGKFIALHRILHRRDGRLALCGMVGVVRVVLAATKLNEYFTLTDTVEEAVALLNVGIVGSSEKTVG